MADPDGPMARLRPWEYALLVFVIAVSVAGFIRVDSASHSVSDTLIGWLPQAALLWLAAWGVRFSLGRRSGRGH